MRRFQAAFLFCILTVMTAAPGPVRAQNRYFDTAAPDPETVVIAVCYPTLYSLNSILGLQKEGLLPVDKLIIAGIYHEDEVSDYAGAQNYIKDKGLEHRFVFHEVRGGLGSGDIYKENACSGEFRTIFSRSDGIIFFGGADIPPEFYDSKTSLLASLSTPARHRFELSLMFHLLGGSRNPDFSELLRTRPDYPVLGLCLGEQTMNVAAGGTLIQDIWFEKYGLKTVEDVISLGREQWHNNPWPKLRPRQNLLRYTMHRIRLKPEGKLVKELGFSRDDHPRVVSSHHQMVDRTGRGIRIIATSMDGRVPEAIEHETYPNVLGLQFHPEFDSLWSKEKNRRIEPGDRPFSLRSVLEENPPSYAFHKAIWTWLREKAAASAAGRHQ